MAHGLRTVVSDSGLRGSEESPSSGAEDYQSVRSASHSCTDPTLYLYIHDGPPDRAKQVFVYLSMEYVVKRRKDKNKKEQSKPVYS
jgi:hypothetical protein